MIRVYNSLTRTKEVFEPVRPGQVGIYLCGPTVYRPSHIGHMVGPVIFDCIKRYLSYCGYKVTLVINITDIDDKLIDEANRRGITVPALAEEMIDDYMANLQALGIDTVDHFPRATEHIADIIEFTADLLAKGYAYVSDGDVYFDVGKKADYGKLSGRSLTSMRGEGGEWAERKRSPVDFALWKSAKPGEPSWPSPWGPGRPGWHIECSVMSSKLLGETFDIHGGGLDLIFPHHENEIAQSEARFGKPMVKYWLHNGLMQAADEVGKVGGRTTRPVEGDLASQEAGKISKSRGASPFRELLQDYDPETIRFFIISTHYRRPIEFSEARLREIATALDHFYRFFQRYQRLTGEDFYRLEFARTRMAGEFQGDGSTFLKEVAEHRQRFLEAMDDDFNTGAATGVLFELLRRLNRFCDEENLEQRACRDAGRLGQLRRGTQVLRELGAVLGLFRHPPRETKAVGDDLVRELIELLVELRAEARRAKNFATADRIRERLAALGIRLEDRPTGTEWTIQR
ncbi:MAG: cysteine--tRNA ligase [Thermoguttaceae bacterium]|nr:cysteine--tRNA ligase [Thermoguttaceae bacterium]MDW8079827.1 cysteine--tRNA ligase [Thermoguttaceae bacterium]